MRNAPQKKTPKAAAALAAGDPRNNDRLAGAIRPMDTPAHGAAQALFARKGEGRSGFARCRHVQQPHGNGISAGAPYSLAGARNAFPGNWAARRGRTAARGRMRAPVWGCEMTPERSVTPSNGRASASFSALGRLPPSQIRRARRLETKCSSCGTGGSGRSTMCRPAGLACSARKSTAAKRARSICARRSAKGAGDERAICSAARHRPWRSSRRAGKRSSLGCPRARLARLAFVSVRSDEQKAAYLERLEKRHHG